MSSTVELKETKISQAPKKTFLQKAAEDLAACRQEVGRHFRWCKTSRRAMVNLLEEAILEAGSEQKGYDDGLFLTYHNIDVMMRGWYFEDRLKLIISTTLLEIQREIITRQESVPAKLSKEKQLLKKSIESLQQACEILREASIEKTETIKMLEKDNQSLRKINKGLEQALAQEKKENARLRKKLERASTSSDSESSEEDASLKFSYKGPGLFGKSSARKSHSSF